MATPLPQDLRQRIVRAVEKGSSIRQAAARYEVSPSAAEKLMRRLRETASVPPDRVGGHRRPVLEPHQDLLRTLVEAKSGITRPEDPCRTAHPRNRGVGALDHSPDAQTHGSDA
ncbi:helix-turn-helix domain-containing protein [Microvirga sp. BT688]|uniref:helix-turn-helix domain-containing protein n=1 Tax=Microvirga sp. TaxID=1873136 RepID=UPI0016824F37|nr:helix-turn-helix domain-containing protein [Microvirga sp.]MBD2745790.1 helix-turn-helix domain-containing protein [Microvirga sp.]